ncbi:MAG TPA: hypothetical protein H9694_05230 [Firmicutes bacterium]|nr:hypothetical protein [Bacillota bacterium]
MNAMKNNWANILRQDLTAYRCLPFWSWNDRLQDEELVRQIRQMKQAGMGGFFMHARSGLTLEYMSDDWFHAVDVCRKEAAAQGMEAWCYDENGWPSGFAGMKLLEDPENWVHYLTCRKTDRFDPAALAVYSRQGDVLRRVPADEPGPGEYWCVYDHTNGSVVDILNPRVVQRFIQETHERYFARFSADFSQTLCGFFTDEPQYFRWDTAYTPVILDAYREEYGEDLLDVLGALFVDCRQAPEMRLRYWKLMNRLFADSFIHQIYDWCEAHGCKITGHAVEEQQLSTQMWCCAGVMPFYEYEHIPGVDWLGREISTEILPRQVSSVAQQLGRPQVLTESFACTGWDATPRELKRIGEWQYVHGVNRMCTHLFAYSIRGNRKKDHPGFFSEHSPWFSELRQFNDHFTALGCMLSQSQEVVHAAVLHPMHAAYLTYDRHRDAESVATLEQAFAGLAERLGAAHIGHHYLDETLLAKYGRVEGSALAVGRCRYDFLLIPDMPCIDGTTAALLKAYVQNGGRLYLDGQRPALIDGRPADTGWLVPNLTWAELAQEEIQVDDPATAVRSTLRRSENGDFLFAVNLSEDTAHTLRYRLRAEGAALFFPLTGECRPLAYEKEEDGICLTLHFKPGQSHIVLLGPAEPAPAPAPEQRERHGLREKPPRALLTACAENTLKLDYVRISSDGVRYSAPLPIPAAADALLRKRRNGDVFLKYSFTVEELPETLAAEIEPMNVRTVWVNGREITADGQGTLEKQFLRADIREYVRQGENELTCRIGYHQPDQVYDILFDRADVTESLINCLTYDTEIDAAYLRGSFGVRSLSGYVNAKPGIALSDGPFVLTALPRELESTRINRQGFPFFAGRMTLRFTAELQDPNRSLRLYGRYATAQVSVNGVEFPPLLLEDELDVRRALRPGINEVCITLCCSNRNLFGPSHVKDDPEPMMVFPDHFDLGKDWQDGRNPRYTDSYSFIDFGLDEWEWIPVQPAEGNR